MKIIAFAMALTSVGFAAHGQQLDVEFTILEDSMGAAGCAGSIVSGLDPNGDGFLAVRAGPGSDFHQIDQLINGDQVRTCARSGSWLGIYYGEPRSKGWVHSNWLIDGAG